MPFLNQQAAGEGAMRFVLILLGMIVAVIFAVQNAMPVNIRLFLWNLNASLAIVVAICFALGAIVAGLMLMPEMFRHRSGERRLQARIADLESVQPTTGDRAARPASTAPPAVTPGASTR
jgi:putative membrane protein